MPTSLFTFEPLQPELFELETALITPRTVVRRFREGEGKPFFDLLYQNTTWLSGHFPYLVEQVRTWEDGERYVRQELIEWIRQTRYAFGVWDKDSATMIGKIWLYELNWHTPKCRMSFFLSKSWAGKGIMTEVFGAVLPFAFQSIQIHRVSMKMAMDNYPAQRLVRKWGFQREGDLREDFRRPSGEWMDRMQFGLTRTLYEKI